MRSYKKEPFVPHERRETLRKEIIAVLERFPMTAKDISREIGIPEREVYHHLNHIKKSISKKGLALEVTPSECKNCGFVFRKRERLEKPSRCPICHKQSITEPFFSIG